MIIYLLAVLWYLIGSFGGLWVSYKVYPVITVGDIIFMFTCGGIGGVVTFIIGSLYLLPNWLNKRVF